jgi:phosphatidylserine/phosphatidylglycerophosphate/cardiolipin synthase-like enzyme
MRMKAGRSAVSRPKTRRARYGWERSAGASAAVTELATQNAPASSSFQPGVTCWRTARADRMSMLVDNAAYFDAAYAALLKARRSILLLGWGFDPRTRLEPDGGPELDAPDEIGTLLKRLAKERPQLDIRVLIWKSALPVSASQDFFPHKARAWFRNTPVRFMLDAMVPLGACHHQKVLVIDDKVAFCGGGDICVDRWDSPDHLHVDARRRMPSGECHAPRHEVMMMMDGEAAQAMGDLCRIRWELATRRSTPPPSAEPENVDPWPEHVSPMFRNVDIAIARTLPAWRGSPVVREVEALHLDAIRHAKHLIYLENQYFTSPAIGEALASRLQDTHGPEIVLISTEHSPSYFDKMTMDRTRSRLIRRLRLSDVYGRFRAYSPVTDGGDTIIVHAKCSIIDDRILRVGSANLNNRSAGFDTECDVAIEARKPEEAAAIAAFRAELIGHFLNLDPKSLAERIAEDGLVAALDDAPAEARRRLKPIEEVEMSWLESVIADYHLGDPLDPFDSWRPFLRRRRLARRVEAIARAIKPPPAAIQADLDD